jgi:hypothetical protein
VMGMRRSVSWDITLCSPLKVNQRFGGLCRLHPQCEAGSNQSYIWFLSWLFLTQKIEATCSSETSVDFQRTTRRYIPDHRTFQLYETSRQCKHTFSYCVAAQLI